jgi:hypothetical protein
MKDKLEASPRIDDYNELMADLPPPDAMYVGFNPAGGGGGGGGRRGAVVAAAQAPVAAPDQAELGAVKAALQARLPLTDAQARPAGAPGPFRRACRDGPRRVPRARAELLSRAAGLGVRFAALPLLVLLGLARGAHRGVHVHRLGVAHKL